MFSDVLSLLFILSNLYYQQQADALTLVPHLFQFVYLCLFYSHKIVYLFQIKDSFSLRIIYLCSQITNEISMKANLLSPAQDPMGAAIADYFRHQKAGKLRVFSSQFEEDEIPIDQLFRSFDEMPELEKIALQMANGKILDAGAGSGCHALALQEMGKEVCAIDISPLSVRTMEERGVHNVCQINLFDAQFLETFDTILMLMNGSGIIGKLENMPDFFLKMKQLLRPGGCILMDSSDLRYLFEDEDGSFLIDLAGDYYGEIDFQMQYKNMKGGSFDWLYVDFQTLSLYAAENGFEAELVKEGEHYDYLACLRMK